MRYLALAALVTLAACAEDPIDAPADPAPQTEAQPAAPALPPYTVADRVQELTGGTYGDVVIPSLTPETGTDTLAAVAQAIANAEGLNRASFYRTEDAMRANFSSSFAEANPGALEAGLLGTYEGGTFQPSPY